MWSAYYKHLKNVAGEPPEDKRTPLEKGRDLFEAGEADAALTQLQAAIAANPNCREAIELVAKIHLGAGRYAEALMSFSRASALAETDARLRYHIGECHQALGNTKFAEEALRKALKLDDKLVDAHVRLGMLLLESGNKADALGCFDRAIYLDRKVVMARFYIAQLCLEAGDLQRALMQLAIVAKLEPEHPPVFVTLGSVFEKLGDHRQVVEELQKAVALGVGDAPLHFRMGQSHLRLGQPEDALKAFQRATELDPQHWEAQHARAQLLEELRRYDQALDVYKVLARVVAYHEVAQPAVQRIQKVLGQISTGMNAA